MRKVLLLMLIFTSSMVNAQNQKPVAVNDSLIYNWDEINQSYTGDTNLRPKSMVRFILNDSDPDGDQISFVSAQFISSNTISTILPTASYLEYRTIQPWSGIDTIQYVISDNRTPALLDTGLIFIITKQPIHKNLNANNINARIDIYSLFGAFDNPGFEAPSGHKTSSIFGAQMWMGGKSGNTIHAQGRRYLGFSSLNPSNAGPISQNSSSPSQTNERWEKVFKVHQHQIDYHINHYLDPNYSVNPNIAQWPAHGDITIGESFYLAPFVDVNNDGEYEPLDGDYPKIKGDQAIYLIYNDDFFSGFSNTMKSEIHLMAYAFQCPDSAIQNTIFVDYTILNKSNRNYDSTYVGMWVDLDVGNSFDDYVQCDVMRNLIFGLNGDDFDDHNNGSHGYENHPAAQGILLLKGPKMDEDQQDNNYGVQINESVNGIGFGDNQIDNEFWGLNSFMYHNAGVSFVGDPVNEMDYYNYLRAHWKNGSNLDYGGEGFQNGSGVTNKTARYMFPADSDSLFFGTRGIPTVSWTEITSLNSPGDRRGVGATGPVTFSPNDTVELTYAFVFGRDHMNTGAQAGVDIMLERVDSIQSYYDQGLLAPCGFPTSVSQTEKSGNQINIYPNPTRDILNITQEINDILNLYVYDITGKILNQTKTSNTNFQLHTSNLTKGVYLLKIQTQGGSKVKTFIKE